MSSSVSGLSRDAQAALTSGRDMWSTMSCEAAGIRSIRMADGPMGIASGRVDERDIALLTPCPTALGASWDRELVARIGEVVAQEALARGVDLVLAPNVNLARSPLTGRLFEMFSEDPFLTGVLASAWINGMQGRGVGSVVKHFVANDSETDRHSMNSVVGEDVLRQVYLQPFEHCVRAGVWALMTAYNRINGEWCSSAGQWLQDVVKDEWSFDGVVLSDWFGTHATVADMSAGLDLEMPGPARHFGPAVGTAVADGEIAAERLANAATRIARLAGRATAARQVPPRPDLDALSLLRRAAIDGSVLLRNEGLLPLSDRCGTIALIGPNAAAPCLQGGSFARIAVDPTRPGPIEAITARFEQTRVIHEPGLAPDTGLPGLHLQDVTALDGEPGVTVEILDTDGDVLFSEVRRTSLLVWFAEMPGLGALTKGGGIRVRTRLIAKHAGTHQFLFGGTGATTLSIDGEAVGQHDPQAAPADIMGVLMRGDSEAATRDLQAGEQVDLDYLMRFEPARAQGIWFGCAEPQPADMTERAVALAEKADVAVLVVGDSQDSSLESVDRRSTRLPAAQVALIEAVCAANSQTLVVVNAARPVLMEWADHAAAILQVWFPGQEFGTALADMLSGLAEPGGRLPLSFAAQEADYPAFDLTPDENGDLMYAEGAEIGYRGLLAAGRTARFPFGHGLGYADITPMSPTMIGNGCNPLFRLALRNRASRAGKAVVQLYLEHALSEGGRSTPRLVGFATVHVPADGSVEVELSADPLSRRWWDARAGGWREPSVGSRYTMGFSIEDRPFGFDIAAPSTKEE